MITRDTAFRSVAVALAGTMTLLAGCSAGEEPTPTDPSSADHAKGGAPANTEKPYDWTVNTTWDPGDYQAPTASATGSSSNPCPDSCGPERVVYSTLTCTQFGKDCLYGKAVYSPYSTSPSCVYEGAPAVKLTTSYGYCGGSGGGGGGGSAACGYTENQCADACGGTYMYSYMTCTCNCGTQ